MEVDMSIKAVRCLIAVFVCSLLVVIALPGKTDVNADDKKSTEDAQTRTPPCSDLEIEVTAQQQSLGHILITVKVCNLGRGQYHSTNVEAVLALYTWRPPQTPPQGDLIYPFTKNMGATFAPRHCTTFQYRYLLPHFSRWGAHTNTLHEGQVTKQFAFFLRKQNQQSFTHCQDTDTENNEADVDIHYMEKK